MSTRTRKIISAIIGMVLIAFVVSLTDSTRTGGDKWWLMIPAGIVIAAADMWAVWRIDRMAKR